MKSLLCKNFQSSKQRELSICGWGREHWPFSHTVVVTIGTIVPPSKGLQTGWLKFFMGEPPLFSLTMKFFWEKAKPPVQEWQHLREWCGRQNHPCFKLKHREKNTRAHTPALILLSSHEIQEHWQELVRSRKGINNFIQSPTCRGQHRKWRTNTFNSNQ